MPIYEYRCESCGAESEVLQRVSDPAPDACPSCAATGTLSKLVSRNSFQLKGGGWYADLYSSTPKTESKSSGGASKPAAEKSAPAPKAATSTSGGS